MDEQVVRAGPVAAQEVEQAVAVGIEGDGATAVQVRMGQVQLSGDLLERAVAEVAKQEVRSALVDHEQVH